MNRYKVLARMRRSVLSALSVALFLSIFALRGYSTPVDAQETATVSAGPYTVLLPAVARESDKATPIPTEPTQPTQPGQGFIPVELQGTWSAGNLPFVEIYDPATGRWLPDVVGLGQRYEFHADGTYTYAAQLTIGSVPCVSKSSTYETGVAHVQGTQIELTATLYRNRTAVCGGTPSESTQLPERQIRTYLIDIDDGGFAQLYLETGASVSNYVKLGGPAGTPQPQPMPVALVGTWRSGELGPDGLFDPQTRTWNENPESGEWFQFNADGTYTYGAFGSRVVNGCTQRAWIYVTGTLKFGTQALKLTPEYFPGPSLQRVHDSCRGGEPVQVVWQEGDQILGWSIDSTATTLTLYRGPSSGTFTRQ